MKHNRIVSAAGLLWLTKPDRGGDQMAVSPCRISASRVFLGRAQTAWRLRGRPGRAAASFNDNDHHDAEQQQRRRRAP